MHCSNAGPLLQAALREHRLRHELRVGRAAAAVHGADARAPARGLRARTESEWPERRGRRAARGRPAQTSPRGHVGRDRQCAERWVCLCLLGSELVDGWRRQWSHERLGVASAVRARVPLRRSQRLAARPLGPYVVRLGPHYGGVQPTLFLPNFTYVDSLSLNNIRLLHLCADRQVASLPAGRSCRILVSGARGGRHARRPLGLRPLRSGPRCCRCVRCSADRCATFQHILFIRARLMRFNQ